MSSRRPNRSSFSSLECISLVFAANLAISSAKIPIFENYSLRNYRDKMKKEIKYISADEAVRVVKSGDHIHLSIVASMPHILIQALVRRADAGELEDVRFHHFHTEGPAPYSEEKYAGIFFDQGFFLGPNVRPNVNGGWADYLPVHLGDSQKLYRSGALN